MPITATDAWDRFRAAFGRSRKGNLWCRLDDGRAATVFPSHGRPDRYSWCISDGLATRYSRAVYVTETDALWGLRWALEEEGVHL
jgi:hypothetical protein